MSEQIQKYNAQALSSIQEVEQAAKLMAASGFFQDAAQMAQAAVKIMAGQEIGIGPFASMVGIHIIKGKPTYGANIVAAKVKGSGKYDYTVDELSETACRLTFWQGEKELGKSSFTIQDAKKALTLNSEKFPRNMLFARAISNGQKWYCPDVTFVTMYTPEDFGAEVDDNGNITNMEVITVSQPEPVKQPAPVSVKPVVTRTPEVIPPSILNDDPMPTGEEARKNEEPESVTDEKTKQEFRHKALWKKVQAAGLLNKETVDIWSHGPKDTAEDIAARCELMHAALGDK